MKRSFLLLLPALACWQYGAAQLAATTTQPVVIDNQDIVPSSSGYANGALLMRTGNGGPNLSLGIRNTGNSTTHYGWLQTAYNNSPQVYGILALNPLGGNVGIGGITPAYKLDVNGSAYVSGSTISGGQVTALNGTRLKATSGNGVQVTGAAGVGMRGVGSNATAGYAAIQTAYDNVNFSCPLVLQDQGGNVLIGKNTQTNSAYKLDINGIVRANKIVVNTTGADFVFGKGYRLPSLDSVEQFVKSNHHLPGIAPAADMQKEGMEVGEQQTKLLQKIEELTLYLIEQNKKVEQQQARLQQQENMLSEQAKQIQRLLRSQNSN